MLKSMTGFGKATKEFEKRTVNVEIRSLNSKGMDLSFRLSSAYREYELELRSEITRLLERGKVDLTVYVESKAVETPVEINSDLAKEYHKKIKQLAAELNEPATDVLYQVLKMPDVLKSERKEADENEWKEIKTVITSAVESLNKFRTEEGRSIEKDFTEHLGVIKTSLD